MVAKWNMLCHVVFHQQKKHYMVQGKSLLTTSFTWLISLILTCLKQHLSTLSCLKCWFKWKSNSYSAGKAHFLHNRASQIDHFIVVCLVTWPLNEGDPALIQASLLLLCKSSCFNANWLDAFTQQKPRGLYQSKVTSSLTAIQRPGHWVDNCKMVYYRSADAS